AAYDAARDAKEKLFNLAEKLLGWPKTEIALTGDTLVRTSTKERRRWCDLLARLGRAITGEAINKDEAHSPVTAFAAQVAEVHVDRETGAVTLRKLTTAHDTGLVINPIGHQGQIEGGVIQGMGYGLIEFLPVQEGRVEVAHFGEYKIPNL